MPTPKFHKGLGRKPDIADKRDFYLPAVTHLGVDAPLPCRVDVFAGLQLPVYDQGSLGSCTANAGVLYRRFLAQRFAQFPTQDEDLSRLFLYYQERKLPWNHDVNSDVGASIRDVFYVLAHIGTCPENDDPYLPMDFASPLLNDCPKVLADASGFRLGAYHRVADVQTAKSVLASGYAVILGFTVYESFENIGPGGKLQMPRQGEAILGGHAVVIRGYNDGNSEFLIQNSWGARWGDCGCFWMPYAFLDDTALSQFDMWMGHLGHPWRLNRSVDSMKK
ncbi:MAG: C1 family peptidase [Terriglobia bacterium]